MKVRVVVIDNRVQLFTDDGTFAEGKVKLEALLRELQADGIKLAEVGEVEQHRHSHEEAHNDHHVHQ